MITFYTSDSLAIMIMSRALNGLSAAILYAAGYAIVADSIGAEDLGKALGTVSLYPLTGFYNCCIG